MKTGKPMRKALTLALAFMLVFALSVPAFATDYFTTITAYYQQGTAPQYSSTIHVNLIVESRQISGNNLYRTVNVALTPNGTQSFYVKDVLLAVQGTNGLIFNDSSGNPIDANDDYVYSITDTNPDPDVTYAPTSPTAWNGWMFRINGQFPLLDDDPLWGASISTAYVTNGDTIHFYHEDMDDDGLGADYAKITSVSNNGNSLTANVKASSTYYEDDYDWIIDDFANYEGVTVEVYNANDVLKDSGTTNASGNVTLNIEDLGTSTCKVKVVRRFLSTGDYQNGLIQNTEDLVVYTPQ